MNVVHGALKHTVMVDDDVTGLVAYLAAPNGTVISLAQGVLLPQCAFVDGTIPCSRNTNEKGHDDMTGALEGSHLHTIYDPFSGTWLEGATNTDVPIGGSSAQRFTAFTWDQSKMTPALETYVPLCGRPGLPGYALTCSEFPVNNFFSPVSGLNPVLEVAITPKTLKAPLIYGDPELRASYPPFNYKYYDLDGHRMSIVDPGTTGLTALNRTAKCWNGPMDPDVVTRACYGSPGLGTGEYGVACEDDTVCGTGTCRAIWPTKICENAPGGSGLRYPVMSRVCTSDADCRQDAGPGGVPAAVEGRCVVPDTRCRSGFLQDRNGHDTGGNLLKLDYDWLNVNNIGGLDSEVFPVYGYSFPTFMQHSLTVVDFPWRDVDNPRASVDGTLVDADGDHYYSPSLLDEADGRFRTAASAAAGSQQIFSTFACDAGTSNQPPVFVRDQISKSRDIPTDVTCSRSGACQIELHIRDYAVTSGGVENGLLSSDDIAIEHGLGLTELNPQQIVNMAGEGTCRGVGHLSCKYQLVDDYDGATGRFSANAIGKIYLKCFVAVDKHPPCTDSSRERCTCRSLPMCFRIRIVGAAPTFVAPTPLAANSRDDNGVLVPGRTDVPACEGHQTVLQLAARDSDGDQVRIHVTDLDIGAAMYATDWLYKPPGGVYQGDFFTPVFSSAGTELPGQCGMFGGYNGTKAGNNAGQADITSARDLSARADTTVKALNSPYLAGVEFVPGTARLDVRYALVPGAGIDTTSAQACADGASFACREKLANVDQVVCAWAYDNSKVAVRRWVGAQDPNGDDIQMWQRDHSNGDMASAQHCWRMRLQAPPVFITDPSGHATPFDPTWLSANGRAFRPTTGDAGAYRHIQVAVGVSRDVTFIAQDPQARDIVEIMVLEDPGVPRGMEVGRSECVLRTGSGVGALPMCAADDRIAVALYPAEPFTAPLESTLSSECSRARRSLTYVPVWDDAGRDFRVCLVAKDNQDVCYGVSPSATPRGWYGETHCVVFEVVAPELRWLPEAAAAFGGTVEVYVGCDNLLNYGAEDTSRNVHTGQPTGNYQVAPRPAPSAAPKDPAAAPKSPGAACAAADAARGQVEVELLGRLPEDSAVVRPDANSRALQWRPERGTEGLTFEVCAVARDVDGIRTLGLTCRGGARHGEPCGYGRTMDESCGEGGVCAATSCVTVAVARCRYCAAPGDSLSKVRPARVRTPPSAPLDSTSRSSEDTACPISTERRTRRVRLVRRRGGGRLHGVQRVHRDRRVRVAARAARPISTG